MKILMRILIILLDEEDDSIGDPEQYEVEVIQDKDNSGVDKEQKKRRHQWWAVKTVKLQKHLRGCGGSKSTRAGKPIDKSAENSKRKGGDLERMKGDWWS